MFSISRQKGALVAVGGRAAHDIAEEVAEKVAAAIQKDPATRLEFTEDVSAEDFGKDRDPNDLVSWVTRALQAQGLLSQTLNVNAQRKGALHYTGVRLTITYTPHS